MKTIFELREVAVIDHSSRYPAREADWYVLGHFSTVERAEKAIRKRGKYGSPDLYVVVEQVFNDLQGQDLSLRTYDRLGELIDVSYEPYHVPESLTMRNCHDIRFDLGDVVEFYSKLDGMFYLGIVAGVPDGSIMPRERTDCNDDLPFSPDDTDDCYRIRYIDERGRRQDEFILCPYVFKPLKRVSAKTVERLRGPYAKESEDINRRITVAVLMHDEPEALEISTDLIEAGHHGALQAAAVYDERCGQSFPQYALPYINHAIEKLLAERKAERFNYNKHTLHNREEIEASEKCACASCEMIFDAKEVEGYADEGTTAICPYCGVDSVIGDVCGTELDSAFVVALNRKWF